MSTVRDIGSRLREVRKHRRMSQAEFAELIDVSRQSICRYELGESVPDADALARVCNRCHVDGHWLLTGEGGWERDTTPSDGSEAVTSGQASQIHPPPQGPELQTDDASLTASQRTDEAVRPRVSLDEIRRIELERFIRDLNLGDLVLQANLGEFEIRWHILDVLAAKYPTPCTLGEIFEMMVARGLHADDRQVSAQIMVLLQSGNLIEFPTPEPGYSYSAPHLDMSAMLGADMNSTTQHFRAALRWLIKDIFPAVKEKRGKLFTSMLRIPQTPGQALLDDLLATTRTRCEAASQATGGSEVFVVLGMSLTQDAP